MQNRCHSPLPSTWQAQMTVQQLLKQVNEQCKAEQGEIYDFVAQDMTAAHRRTIGEQISTRLRHLIIWYSYIDGVLQPDTPPPRKPASPPPLHLLQTSFIQQLPDLFDSRQFQGPRMLFAVTEALQGQKA